MTRPTTVEAIYEKGTLRLRDPLPRPENARVWVTVQTDQPQSSSDERGAWLKLSEAALTRTWDNSDDDVFIDLLTK
jgi:hypothetical protein